MHTLDFDEEDVVYLAAPERTYFDLINFGGEMVSRRALIGWTTHGHTGVDVNLYAYGRAKKIHVVVAALTAYHSFIQPARTSALLTIFAAIAKTLNSDGSSNPY